MPEPDNMRLQTVSSVEQGEVLLTMLPDSTLTVILKEGHEIEKITLAQTFDLEVRVPLDGNSFVVIPNTEIPRLEFLVETSQRNYPFILRTQNSPLAAMMVQFEEAGDNGTDLLHTAHPEGDQIWSYRLRGDREVRPASIRDDAYRTFIEYGPGQALPAVFAIGPTGDEEVVNGHMRGGTFVIDRVYEELVFRIDNERATARRNDEPESEASG